MLAPEISTEDEDTAALRADLIDARHAVEYYAALEAKVQAELARARGRAAAALLALEVHQ